MIYDVLLHLMRPDRGNNLVRVSEPKLDMERSRSQVLGRTGWPH
jgi:hypothetical protein